MSCLVVARQGCTSLTSFVIGTEYSVRNTSGMFFGPLFENAKCDLFTKTGSGRTYNRGGATRNKSELYYYYYYYYYYSPLVFSQPTSRSTAIKAGWSYWSLLGGIAQSFGAKVPRTHPTLPYPTLPDAAAC
eukprot:COSAG04_NODE_2030_length_4968_cov_2.464572_2_plen_131_part_00